MERDSKGRFAPSRGGYMTPTEAWYYGKNLQALAEARKNNDTAEAERISEWFLTRWGDRR